jgi:hypothetical protein
MVVQGRAAVGGSTQLSIFATEHLLSAAFDSAIALMQFLTP